MEQSQAIDVMLAEFRASETCEGPIRHGRLESAHHMEEAAGG